MGRRRGLVGALLLVPTVVLGMLVHAGPSRADDPHTARLRASVPITVATFNVQTQRRGGPRWKERRHRVLEQLRRTRADVVVLQESQAFGPTRADFPAGWLAERAGYAIVPYRYSGFDEQGRPFRPEALRNQGHQVLYRPGRIELDLSVPGTISSFSRTISHVVLRDRRTGRSFTVLAMHLLQGKTRADEERRRDTVAGARRSLARMGETSIPFPSPLWIGDLNTDRLTRPRLVVRQLRRSGAVDAFTVARRRTEGRINTFNGRRRVVESEGRRIDQIWVPRGSRVLRWGQVVDVRDGRYIGRFASDHNPVVVRVRL